MSTPTKNPAFVSQTPRTSGDVFTGELLTVRGGGRASCLWSGALAPNLSAAPGALASGTGHVILYQGGGRLNSVSKHQGVLQLSGVAINFYDAAVQTVSGVSVSGQKLLYVLDAPQGASGSFTPVGVTNVDMPFFSGLCVSAPSGAGGFTVSFTPETGYADD